MQINEALARQISARTKAVLKYEVIITDAFGLILAGSKISEKFAPDAQKSAATKSRINGKIGGLRVVWIPFLYEEKSIGAFGILEDGSITPDVISLMQGLGEVIIYQNAVISRLQPAIMLRSAFIGQVLTDGETPSDQLYRQADILQINLRDDLYCILMHLSGFEQKLHSEIAHLTSEEQKMVLANRTQTLNDTIQSRLTNQNPLFGYLGNNIFAILIPQNRPHGILSSLQFKRHVSEMYGSLADVAVGHRVSIGIGQYYPELGGLRKSYQEASLALDVGLKVWGEGQAYHLKNVGMFVSLTNISQERKVEIAHQLLHPLLSDPGLYKSVRTFLDCGLNLSIAAEKLHIHRNTLIYRLNKTKKIINLDPRHFEDALQIKLGLMFYSPA